MNEYKKVKKISVSLAYRKDGRLNQARFSLAKKIQEYLGLSPEDKSVSISYNGEVVTIRKSKENQKEDSHKSKFHKIKDVVYQKSGKDQQYYSCKLFLPLPLVTELKLSKEDNELVVFFEDNSLKVKKEKVNMKKGEMITLKVNKGGIGKTCLSTWLAHGLAELGYKTLLLTSDSQNNVLDITFKDEHKPEFKDGLKHWVTKGDGELIKIRNNFHFIPLESSVFGSSFLKKLPSFLSGLKQEYDYIINDSIPTVKLDEVFVNSSEKVIIPAYCDRSTVEGVMNVIDEAGIDKVFAIIVNRFENVRTQNKYFEQLKEALEDTDIIFPPAIPQRSSIANQIDKGKTIWESNAKQIVEVQEILLELLYELTGGKINE